MTAEKLKEIVIKSLKKLCENDSVLIDIAVKEECINHKFAQYIEEYTKQSFPGLPLDIDVEYNKYKDDPQKMGPKDPIRPDILVHKRQSGNTDNYLAVEAKKGYSTEHDKDKIKWLISNQEFNYALGCLVSYQPKKTYLIVKFWQSDRCGWEEQKINKQPFQVI
jgi:hypothetical protein